MKEAFFSFIWCNVWWKKGFGSKVEDDVLNLRVYRGVEGNGWYVWVSWVNEDR